MLSLKGIWIKSFSTIFSIHMLEIWNKNSKCERSTLKEQTAPVEAETVLMFQIWHDFVRKSFIWKKKNLGIKRESFYMTCRMFSTFSAFRQWKFPQWGMNKAKHHRRITRSNQLGQRTRIIRHCQSGYEERSRPETSSVHSFTNAAWPTDFLQHCFALRFLAFAVSFIS